MIVLMRRRTRARSRENVFMGKMADRENLENKAFSKEAFDQGKSSQRQNKRNGETNPKSSQNTHIKHGHTQNGMNQDVTVHETVVGAWPTTILGVLDESEANGRTDTPTRTVAVRSRLSGCWSVGRLYSSKIKGRNRKKSNY